MKDILNSYNLEDDDEIPNVTDISESSMLVSQLLSRKLSYKNTYNNYMMI